MIPWFPYSWPQWTISMHRAGKAVLDFSLDSVHVTLAKGCPPRDIMPIPSPRKSSCTFIPPPPCPPTHPHRALLIPVGCLNWIWRAETVWHSLSYTSTVWNCDIFNYPHSTGRKGWGEEGRVMLSYQLILLPWVPKLLWKSSGSCDVQAAVMHGCKNGRAYAQSPAEHREVLGTISCPLCYCKLHWFESVWSTVEQIKFQSFQLRKMLMRILWRKKTKNSSQKNPKLYRSWFL